jgi:hypothetical protein
MPCTSDPFLEHSIPKDRLVAREFTKLEITELLAGELKKAGITQQEMRKRLNIPHHKWAEFMNGDFTVPFVGAVLLELGLRIKCSAVRWPIEGDLWIYNI